MKDKLLNVACSGWLGLIAFGFALTSITVAFLFVFWLTLTT
jgi:hypothetical protein